MSKHTLTITHTYPDGEEKTVNASFNQELLNEMASAPSPLNKAEFITEILQVLADQITMEYRMRELAETDPDYRHMQGLA